MRDYPNSAELLTRASVIPSGSLTRSKAPGRFFAIGDGPLFAVDGYGAMLRTADQDNEGRCREYIDMLCALGAISLGYGVTNAATGAISDGWIYSLPHPLEAEAAHAVLDHVAPWAERCRFTKTGTEACMAAWRIAKQATGRPHVMVGDWAYHGWNEWSWKKPDGAPSDDRTWIYKHGEDIPTWFDRELVEARGIAAFFWEPHRWEPTDIGWLKATRQFCADHGILFVTDEMIYCGRFRLGGATEMYSVIPDLACMGKAIGNGAPIACVVGNADLLDAHGQMVSGTYSGDTAALAAVVEVIDRYIKEPVIDTLWARGRQLRAGLGWICAAHPSLNVVVEGAGDVHLRLRFAHPDHGKLFSAQMAERGVLQHPDCINICYSHTQGQIDRVIVAAGESMDALELSQ